MLACFLSCKVLKAAPTVEKTQVDMIPIKNLINLNIETYPELKEIPNLEARLKLLFQRSLVKRDASDHQFLKRNSQYERFLKSMNKRNSALGILPVTGLNNRMQS